MGLALVLAEYPQVEIEKYVSFVSNRNNFSVFSVGIRTDGAFSIQKYGLCGRVFSLPRFCPAGATLDIYATAT